MFKGAVFDMDGLMIDSERLVYSIWQEMLDEDGKEFNLDIFKKTIGLRSEDSYEYYKSVYGDDFDYPAYKAESRLRYFKRIEKNGVPVKKGLYEIFDYLKSVGCKISLATSTSSQTALKIMKKINLYDIFDAFVCGDDVKNGKPDPAQPQPQTNNRPREHGAIKDADINPLRNKRDVWKINTVPFKGGHYAAYPPKLVETCLLAGCPEGGVVLDPFMGSGTTGMVASQMGRHFVGVELNPEYTELAYKRIGGEI